MLDIAKTLSAPASLRALTGSTAPGAVPPLVPLGAAVVDQPACGQAVVTTRGHGDAEVIDLAGRVKALAARHERVYIRMVVVHGRVDKWNFANRPMQPEPIPSDMTLVRSRTDTHEVTHIEQSLRVLAEQNAQREAFEATNAAHEAAVERRRARTRESYLDKLQARMWWRLERWTVELTHAELQTQAGLAAKAAAALAVNKMADDLPWAQDLALAVSRDAVRIITAEAEVRTGKDRRAAACAA